MFPENNIFQKIDGSNIKNRTVSIEIIIPVLHGIWVLKNDFHFNLDNRGFGKEG